MARERKSGCATRFPAAIGATFSHGVSRLSPRPTRLGSAQLNSARQRRPSCRLLATAVLVASEPEPEPGSGPGPDVLSDFIVCSPSSYFVLDRYLDVHNIRVPKSASVCVHTSISPTILCWHPRINIGQDSSIRDFTLLFGLFGTSLENTNLAKRRLFSKVAIAKPVRSQIFVVLFPADIKFVIEQLERAFPDIFYFVYSPYCF